MIDLRHGDMRDVLPTIEAESVHSVVTDPPYHLGPSQGRSSRAPEGMYATMRTGFMGKQWDGGSIAFDPDTWRAVHRVLRPGGFLLSFGGTRTQHRMICAIEDAGFEIRDVIAWIYGSGFPKSLDISKAIDRAAGAEREKIRYDNPRNPKATGGGRDGMAGATRPWIEEAMRNGYHEMDGPEPSTDAARQWNGWGTALKPAMELICVARKPLSERTVAGNVLRHGTGGINVDATRIVCEERPLLEHTGRTGNIYGAGIEGSRAAGETTLGRWPANVVHDGSPEVEAAFAAFGERTSGTRTGEYANGTFASGMVTRELDGSSGSASRFFYSAKATASDRADSRHPTVKPIDLIRWLVRLVTPPNGTVLDPFAGSGTTAEAAMLEGFDAILIEREVEHHADIQHRQRRWHGGDLPLFAEAAD